MNLKRFVNQHASTILSAVSIAGVVCTSIFTAKSTLKAERLVEEAKEENGDELTKTELVKIGLESYWPAIISGVSTIVCICGANVLSMNQQASLISAYAFLDNSYKEYRSKVNELYGEDADQMVISSIAKDRISDYKYLDPADAGDVMLFYDVHGERYFETTLANVISAEYKINQDFVTNGYAYLNDFYRYLGIEPTDFGRVAGWCMDDDMTFWIDFRHLPVMLDDNLECVMVWAEYEPVDGFLDF